ncbi:phosphatidylglycerophosphatase A [bacterium]|nr:phosphatidylglycerophosphatase A [bacterium]
MRSIAKLIATGFYSGYFPFASGTVGSLVGLLIYYPMTKLPNNMSYLLLTAFLFFIGIWASTEAEVIYNQKDSGKIVIDEIVGMLVTMFALPVTPKFVIMGFLIFRIADVTKPMIRWAEKIPGGFGVMLDDLLAAILCNLLLHLVNFLMK